jgi:hypothetical protein
MNLFAFYKHKIFGFWLVLISFSSGYSQCCTYTLDMQDSFSDGWDGATLEVIVNGSSQGLFSAPNGSPSATENIVVCDGQSIELIFNSGAYDDEITYSLSSPSGVVFSDGPSPAIGSAFSGVGSCSISTCDAGPTSGLDSNLESFLLLGNTSQINYIGCPGVLGVEDQTTLGTDLSAGGNYAAEVQFGTCGGNYAGAGEAWVDWNQNGVYESTETIGSWQGTPPSALTNFNFFVPGNSVSGLTTMRVTQQEGGSLPLDPCAVFTWGSVVEFSIFITGGIDCTGFDGDNSTVAIVAPSIPYVDTNSTVMCYSSQSAVYNSPDVFYKFGVNPLAANTTVSLCNSSFDTYLTILDLNLNVIAFNDDGISCSSGESEVTFASGAYDTLYAVVEGWNNESGEYIINITEELNVGIGQNLKAEFNLYPSPAKDLLNFSGGLISKVDIFDIQGRKVLNSANTAGITALDISFLNSGSYFVKMQGINEEWQTKQLIIANNE